MVSVVLLAPWYHIGQNEILLKKLRPVIDNCGFSLE